MRARWWGWRGLEAGVAAGVLWGAAVGCHEPVAPAEPVPSSPAAELRAALDSIRRKYQLPALGAALVRLDSAPVIATVGVRRWGTRDSVSDSDVWHLGSNTKAITATHLAILVDRGMVRWDATLESLYPELASSMQAQYRTATLSDVTAHRAGLVRDLLGPLWSVPDGTAVRAQAIPGMLDSVPVGPAGQFAYSNVGYMLVGSVVERLVGGTWEAAVQRDLLDPLGLGSATVKARPVNGAGQAWPHQLQSGVPVPISPDYVSVPWAMSCAGRMHMSLADWSRFALMHLRGERGIDDVLPAARIVELHRPWHGIVGANAYAGGWNILDDAWAGRVLEHGGSDGLNLSNAWIAPERGFAVLVVTNLATAESQRAVFEARDWIIAYMRR